MTELIIGIIFFIIIIVYLIYPAINTPNNNEITTQDGLEDIITDEKTIYIKTHNKNNKEIKSLLTTTDDFIEKPVEQFKDTVSGRQLTEHIAKVIELNPNSKKHLTKRERKTVDKIIEEKNKK